MIDQIIVTNTTISRIRISKRMDTARNALCRSFSKTADCNISATNSKLFISTVKHKNTGPFVHPFCLFLLLVELVIRSTNNTSHSGRRQNRIKQTVAARNALL